MSDKHYPQTPSYYQKYSVMQHKTAEISPQQMHHFFLVQ